MSESQSRYSIVNELTETKLEIITAKSNLDSEVKIAKQRTEELREELKDWEASQKDESARTKREKEREIKKAVRDASNAEEKKKTKGVAYEEKLKAIDEALDKIQKISESSAQEAKQ